ncbi:MAG: heat-inducible transcription repressor HrcA [Firmicutes bacterium]|nr:heat-inducible transcription repressor HrcA [Bacillota bacterium]
MPFYFCMDDRKKRILQAVTDDYIDTAEPVGSRTIAKRYNLGVSPATIRSEMADLEESGYLEQPHVSAGRIPSHKGYRFYVDFIMQTKNISERDRLRIRRRLEEKKRELDLITEETAKILAQLSNYAAFVLSPVSKAAIIKRLELVQLDSGLILVILVVNPGFVRTHLVMTERRLEPEQLAYINVYLNSRLQDVPLSKIGMSLLREIATEFKEYNNLIETTLETITRLFEDRKEQTIFTDGQINILKHPEFKEAESAKRVFDLIAESDAVSNLLIDTMSTGALRVVIGKESSHPDMDVCSVVGAPYEVGGVPVGAIGVLGPTRMHYAEVVAIVELVAGHLGEILTKMLIM